MARRRKTNIEGRAAVRAARRTGNYRGNHYVFSEPDVGIWYVHVSGPQCADCVFGPYESQPVAKRVMEENIDMAIGGEGGPAGTWADSYIAKNPQMIEQYDAEGRSIFFPDVKVKPKKRYQYIATRGSAVTLVAYDPKTKEHVGFVLVDDLGYGSVKAWMKDHPASNPKSNPARKNPAAPETVGAMALAARLVRGD